MEDASMFESTKASSNQNSEGKSNDSTIKDDVDENKIDDMKSNDKTTEMTSKVESSEKGISVAASELESGDVYFYTKRQEFTSELFKIEVKNLPRYLGFKELRKLANKHGVFPKKVKFGNDGNMAYMSFSSEEERQKAIESLGGLLYKGRELQVKKARPKADPYVLKRHSAGTELSTVPEKKTKNDQQVINSEDDSLTPSERVLNSVTPLWKVPYPEQLKRKQQSMHSLLEKVTSMLKPMSVCSWVRLKSKEYNGICCPLNPIKESPVTEKYRNKVEFNIAKGINGEETIGFRTGNYKGGQFGLVEPSACINVTDEAKEIAKHFQECIQNSKYPSYDAMLHTGYWRQLTVRTCRSKQIMVIVQIHPQQLKQEELDEIKEFVKSFFTSDALSVKIHSLYLQTMGQRQSALDEIETFSHLYGTEVIEEEMMNMKFRISPNAFFQVNTSATERLYSVVQEYALTSMDSIILDICCGTGTIGLNMAKNGARKVIGFELCKQAIEDAKNNAEINGITNITFIQGKVENTIFDAVRNLPSKANVVAIVDPPRAGLHKRVVQCLRKCAQIQRLVYVSCNPKLASANFVDLCRDQSKRNRGIAFELEEATPVDLFPHTDYCELVLLFTRNRMETCEQSLENSGDNPEKIPDLLNDPECKE